MAKTLSRKEARTESAIPKRRAGAVPILKSKINLKENDRIARMKAAREAYSKLSQERVNKQTVDPQQMVTTSSGNHDVKKEFDAQSKPSTRRSSRPLTAAHLKSVLNSSPSRCRNDYRAAATTRIKKHKDEHQSSASAPSPAATSFKPMASSLEMIRNGGIRNDTGRASSIYGARSLAPRPSLLPLGINIFESNVSLTDKMKVRDFIASRSNTGATPKKASSLSFGPVPSSDLQSARSLRSVRFCVEATITEQRESGGDEVLREERVIRGDCGFDAPSSSENAAPMSILKKRKVRDDSSADVVFASPHRVISHCPDKANTFYPGPSSRSSISHESRAQLSFPSTSSESSVSEKTSNIHASDFVQSYTQLFNMSDEEWKSVEPIMLDELIGYLNEKKKWLEGSVALMPEDTSSSLLSLPEDIPKPPARGFRKVIPSVKHVSADLQANQEVMLINETAKRNASPSPTRLLRHSLRLRQKDPVSSALGGDSPFIPIRGSPIH